MCDFSSLIRDPTHIPYTEKWSLNHQGRQGSPKYATIVFVKHDNSVLWGTQAEDPHTVPLTFPCVSRVFGKSEVGLPNLILPLNTVNFPPEL